MKRLLVVMCFCLTCCGFAMTVRAECDHTFTHSECRKIDDNYCAYYSICDNCGAATYLEKYPHSWSEMWDDDSYTYVYKKKDNTYHYQMYKCETCGATKGVQQKHDWNSGECIRLATVFAPGIIRYECSSCGATKDMKENYNPGSQNSVEYLDEDCISDVYRTSKSVTVKLYEPIKGGVIQLKFGKKTYKKTIKNNSKKIKIKIKKPKWGKKFTVKLMYKSQTLYSDWDYVWYAKKLKKGMTKKQAKFTWGSPDDKASASGGWSYWYYEDGSSIGFKNGRVRYWYDAAG